MSDSIWNDPRITAYVLDELSEDDRQAFEAELEGNTDLQAAVAEAQNVTGQLEDLFAAEETPKLDRDRIGTVVAPAPSSRSWRTPMIAMATAASLLMLIGGPIWFSRQDAMIVGQIATEDELATYGKEMAKETALEGMSHSENEAAQTEFAPLESKKKVLFRSRLENESIQSIRSATSSAIPASADSVRPDGIPFRSSGGMGGGGGASPQFARAPKSVADAGSTFIFGGGPPTRASSAVTRDLDGDGDIDEADAAIAKNPTIIPGFAEATPKPTPHFVRQPVPAEEYPSAGKRQSVRASTLELREAQASSRTQMSIATPRIIMGEEEQAQTGFAGVTVPLRDRNRKQSEADHDGRRPGNSGDKFEPIIDNPFKRVAEHSLSTFSVDVDTASYSKTRDFLARAHQLPQPGAVRIEELINYFNYDYQPPTADDVHPFTTHTVVTSCPWNPEHRLARIALKGKVIEKNERPSCNLVFLLDTSGSMNQPNKLPLVVEGMQMLLKQLSKKDRVAIAVYAGSAGLVLDSTAVKKKGKKKIRNALTQLNAGGSTNGGAGIALAYETARDNFISDGVNRVILCTDGDFNVGTTGTDALVRMVEQEAKGGIFLSVLGFGMGNHNDSMLEQISGKGNGNYAFIDNKQEARKVLVDQTSATLVTIAKDVKLQIEFNPKQVSSYRLIGYENRVLAKEDFNDDKKDAGEIGAGHAVTALYEIVPAGTEADESRPAVDVLKYQSPAKPSDAANSDELMTLKLRYKAPDGDTSTLVEFPVADETVVFGEADKDVRFAAAVAGFGMQLRRSDYKGTWTLSDVQAVAEKSKGEDEAGLRSEFIDLVRKASELMGQE